MFSVLKNKVLFWLGSPEKAKWLAPLRTIRTKLGWRCAPKPLDKCKRILVIRPDEIGDVVLTSPFLRNLRNSAPNAHITVLVSPVCFPLLENCPHVDEVYSLPFKSSSQVSHRARVVVAALRLKWSLLCRGFDLVLLPRLDSDWYSSEFTAHLLAGWGSVVINSAEFVTRTINVPGSPMLVDKRHAVGAPQSDVLSDLEFLQAFGGNVGSRSLEFWDSEKDLVAAEAWLSAEQLEGRVIVFHPPGGRSLLRRWPMGRSREFVAKLLNSLDFSVVVVGGPEDDWVKSEFASLDHPRLRVAVGLLRLGELGALIRRCGYFVGGDSGPMHIAASVGAKTIGIFGPGSEIRFKPWSEKSRVLSMRLECSPDQLETFEAYCLNCIHAENRCMTELQVDAVLAEVRTFFAA